MSDPSRAAGGPQAPQATSGASLAAETPLTPSLVVSANNGDPVVTIGLDGRVTLNPQVPMDDAAKAFWTAVRTYPAVNRVPSVAFQFSVVVRTQKLNGSQYTHVRLRSWRNDAWSVVGVLQLHAVEWECFAAICRAQGIEITSDEPAVSSMRPQTR